ncbi:DUF1697 domain-containing protein [Asticcacaulis endophyticus]|nr:DUF1697 domain-containing protein [Asticcacaulis endophyticus]
MQTFVILFRGINVGGHKKMPMKTLKTALESLGYTDVETYIQSGNVVLKSSDRLAKIETDVTDVVKETFGFECGIHVLSRDDFSAIITANPFKEATQIPKSLHVYCLKSPAINPDHEVLGAFKKEDEAYALTDLAFYLHTPSGLGTSKLAEKIEKALKVTATARNWNTVMALSRLSLK